MARYEPEVRAAIEEENMAIAKAMQNYCASVCRRDILLPSGAKGGHPIVMYPGECCYCWACVMVCTRPGAIKLKHP